MKLSVLILIGLIAGTEAIAAQPPLGIKSIDCGIGGGNDEAPDLSYTVKVKDLWKSPDGWIGLGTITIIDDYGHKPDGKTYKAQIQLVANSRTMAPTFLVSFGARGLAQAKVKTISIRGAIYGSGSIRMPNGQNLRMDGCTFSK